MNKRKITHKLTFLQKITRIKNLNIEFLKLYPNNIITINEFDKHWDKIKMVMKK